MDNKFKPLLSIVEIDGQIIGSIHADLLGDSQLTYVLDEIVKHIQSGKKDSNVMRDIINRNIKL